MANYSLISGSVGSSTLVFLVGILTVLLAYFINKYRKLRKKHRQLKKEHDALKAKKQNMERDLFIALQH